MSKDAVRDLVSYWAGQGIIVARGNGNRALVEFETRNDVRLPPDLRAYFEATDGMPKFGSGCDRNGYRFWALEEVEAVPAVCARSEVPLPEGSRLNRHFVFVDYFEWSWAYAIDLSGHDPTEQPVIHVGTLKPKTVARSFSEFVEIYVRDGLELYPDA